MKKMHIKLSSAVKTLILFPVLPIVIFARALRGRDRLGRKILLFLWVIVFMIPLWVAIYGAVGFVGARMLGFLTVPIPIAGTGSMYPTFPKGTKKTPKEEGHETVARPKMYPYPNGIKIDGKRYFGHTIEDGDIVVFANAVTRKIEKERYGEEHGFVKRVVGAPGDLIEIRDGLTYRNGQALKEPYTARPHSTFGGKSIAECRVLRVPPDHYVVMGDNRKASDDSRHDVGLISEKDIEYVLPIAAQKGVWDTHYRDTANDLTAESKLKIDTREYLDLLNKARGAAGKKPLKYNSKLEAAAALRGATMIATNDFTLEATRSGYTMATSMKDAGYFNIVTGESFSQGFFEASEAVENIFEFQRSTDFVLNSDYEEVGLAQVEGAIEGCPTQVVVTHFGGYKPPNYEKKLVESWRKLATQLAANAPSWSRLKGEDEFYKANHAAIDRVIEIFSIRLARVTAIASRMEANQWLTKEEQQFMKDDEALGLEQEALSKELIKKGEG